MTTSHPSQNREFYPDPSAPIAEALLKAPVRHPLIYRKRIQEISRQARAGDWVAVYAKDPEQPESAPRLLGYGLYNPRSEIAIRIVRWGESLPDSDFWRHLMSNATALRRDLLRLDEVADCYRVVHAEADGIPGLVIDRYGDVLSAEVFSWAIWPRCPSIMEILSEQLGTAHHVIRTSPKLLSQEGFDAATVRSPDCPARITVSEYGTRFRIDLSDNAHKTGFFCDQRENRAALARKVHGRSLLDLCCYTGGFAIQAKKLGGAAEVIGVDLDRDPLQLAQENANLNQVRIRWVQADVFPYMRDMIRSGRQFDAVVLDPPKLIHSRSELEDGTKRHYDLNRLAMQLVRPGGLFLTCSCAGLLPTSEFTRLVVAAARNTSAAVDGAIEGTRRGRNLRILGHSGAGGDHPVSGRCPEGEYLKAVWATLDDD